MRIVNFTIQKLKNKHTLNDKIHSYVITYMTKHNCEFIQNKLTSKILQTGQVN
jgi:hypothetical protein